MSIKFRALKPDEIDVKVTDNGRVLLYKNARVDMDILDETVGNDNWALSRNGDSATLSIYDEAKEQWISKTDVGESTGNLKGPKATASDALKRAAVLWGIGRELYTAPAISFIKKTTVVTVKSIICDEEDTGLYTKRRIRDLELHIEYAPDEKGGKTAQPIDLLYRYGKAVSYTTMDGRVHAVKDKHGSKPAAPAAPATASASIKAPAGIADDDVLLIGKYNGKTYAEAKADPGFHDFVAYMKAHPQKYSDPTAQAQFDTLVKA